MSHENFNSSRDQEVRCQWNIEHRGACWVEVLTHVLTNRNFVSIAVNLTTLIGFASICHRLHLNRRQFLSAPSVAQITRFMPSPGFCFHERVRPSVNRVTV
jgi:hypothetical protein